MTQKSTTDTDINRSPNLKPTRGQPTMNFSSLKKNKSVFALSAVCLLLFIHHIMFHIKLLESQIKIDYYLYFYFILNSSFIVSLFLLIFLFLKKFFRLAFSYLFLISYLIFTLGTVKHVQRFGDIIRFGSYENIDELLAIGPDLIKLFNHSYDMISIFTICLCLSLMVWARYFHLRFNKKFYFYGISFILANILISTNFLFQLNSHNLHSLKNPSKTQIDLVIYDFYLNPLNYAITYGFITTYVGVYLEDRLLTTLAKNYRGTPGKLSLLLNKIHNTNRKPPMRVHKGVNSIKPNFIFIQFESLDPWLFNHTIDGNAITPFLSELKRHSLYFHNFYSVYNLGGSSDPERGSLLSLLPHPSKNLNVKKSYYSLVDMLKNHGYQTAIFHSNEINFFNRGQLHNNIGMDKKYFGKDAFYGQALGMNAFDQTFYKQSLVHIKKYLKKDSPFLLYFITIQSHYPFESYKKETKQYLFGNNPIQKNINLDLTDKMLMNYTTSIYEADQALEFFFKELYKNNLLDNTFIFIYGDHNSKVVTLKCKGECIPLFIYHKDLPEKGITRTPSLKSHFLSKFIKNKNNSLWLKKLSFNKGTYLKVSSHLDISPTISYILGIEEPIDWLGSPLVSSNTTPLTSKHIKEYIEYLTIRKKINKYPIIPPHSAWTDVFKDEENVNEPLYYEHGIALSTIDMNSFIINSKDHPFKLISDKDKLLHYYIHSANKFEPFK